MKVAVIGCGSIGRRHIRTLLSLGCDVYGYDSSEKAREQASEINGARIFGLVGGDESFEAYVIATPYEHHLSWAKQAVARRSAFFVEKPLGPLSEADEWLALSQRSDLPVHQVGYQCRFHPEARRIYDMQPVAVELTCRVDMRTWPGTYGDPWLECSHDIDLALWWLRQQVAVTDVISLSPSCREIAIARGSWITIDWLSDAPWTREWLAWSDATKGYQKVFWYHRPLGETMYHDELAHFLARVRGERDIGCAATIPDGLAVLELCRQAEQVMTRETVA